MLVNENQKLNEIHNDLLMQVNTMNDEIQSLKDDLRLAEDSNRKQEAQVEDVMVMQKRVCEENEKLEKMFEDTASDKMKLEGHLSALHHEWEEVKADNQSLHAEMTYQKDQLETVNQKVLDQSRHIAQMSQQLEDLKYTNESLKQENSMFKSNNNEQVKSVHSKDHTLESLQNELNAVYGKMDKMDEEFGELLNEKRDLEEQCSQLQAALSDKQQRGEVGQENVDTEELQEENDQLRAQLTAMKDTVKLIEGKLSWQSGLEVNKLREENSKLKLENFKLKSEKEEPSINRISDQGSDLNI